MNKKTLKEIKNFSKEKSIFNQFKESIKLFSHRELNEILELVNFRLDQLE